MNSLLSEVSLGPGLVLALDLKFGGLDGQVKLHIIERARFLAYPFSFNFWIAPIGVALSSIAQSGQITIN